FPAGGIPDSYLPAVVVLIAGSSRRQLTAVGVVGQAPDIIFVVRQIEDGLPLLFQGPDLDDRLLARRGDMPPVGAEGNALDGTFVTRQAPEPLCRRDVPDRHLVLACQRARNRGEVFPIRAPRHRPDGLLLVADREKAGLTQPAEIIPLPAPAFGGA